MATPTGYLYGDSTPSPLKTDFVAFLRDAFDFSVQVLLCDARLTDAFQRVAQLSEVTEKEIERAEALATHVSRALDGAALGDQDSLATRCAVRIRQGAKDLIRSEAEGARAAVAAEQTRAAQAMASDHDSAVKALEALLLRHTLPDSVGVTRVSIGAGGQYEAQLHAHTPYGLEWIVALEIPPAHPFAHVLRIDRVVERLDVEAPEEGGWLHKEVRIRPQRFDRLHLAELTVDPEETTVRLRTAPDGSGSGFDVLFKHAAPNARLVRILEDGISSDSPYDVVGDDLAKLRSLHDGLVAMAIELGEHKKSLRAASLEKTPIDAMQAPRVLVERLVANIAPTVQEIARRSLVPGELVLKRLLGDNHRDEVFLSTRELERKLEVVPLALRRTFEPLKLWEAHRPDEVRSAGSHNEPILLAVPKPVTKEAVPKEKKPAEAIPAAIDEGWAQQHRPNVVAASPTVIVTAESQPEALPAPAPAKTPSQPSRPPRP